MSFKQKVELFFTTSWSLIKTILLQIVTKEFQIQFQNSSEQEMESFSHFQTPDKKTSLSICFSFLPRSLKLIF